MGSESIVDKHGGSIKIRSSDAAEKNGTVISIFLAVCRQSISRDQARMLGSCFHAHAYQPEV